MAFAAIAPAVISAIGGYLASRKASNSNMPSQDERAMQQQMLSNLRTTAPIGQAMLANSQSLLGGWRDYNQTLANGSQSAMMQKLGPQLAQSDQMARAAQTRNATLAPRSGMAASANLQMLNSQFANRQNALLGMRSDAQGQLGQLGELYGQLGSGLMGQSNGGTLGLLGNALSNRQNSFDQARLAGQGIYQMVNGIDWSKFGSGAQQQQQLPTRQLYSQYAPGGVNTVLAPGKG